MWGEGAGMERREWCDAHAHLQDSRFAGRLDGALFRARTAGVRLIHVNGTCEEDWEAALRIGEREAAWVTVSVGMHPWRVAGAREGWMIRRSQGRRPMEVLSSSARASLRAFSQTGEKPGARSHMRWTALS